MGTGHRLDVAGSGSDGQPVNRIGFAADGGETAVGDARPLPSEQPSTERLQVAVAAGIGFFCLLVLILLRNIGWNQSPAAVAAGGQFRDFVSGCVGFLIGSPTHRNSQTP